LSTQKSLDAGSLSQNPDGGPQARFTRGPIKVNLSASNPLAKQKKFDGIAELAMQKGPSFLRGVWSGFGVFGSQEPSSPSGFN